MDMQLLNFFYTYIENNIFDLIYFIPQTFFNLRFLVKNHSKVTKIPLLAPHKQKENKNLYFLLMNKHKKYWFYAKNGDRVGTSEFCHRKIL